MPLKLARSFPIILLALLVVSPSWAQSDDEPLTMKLSPETIRAIHEKAAGSLVAVKFTWASEVRKFEAIGPGIVVGDDGLVMASIALLNPMIPDEQLQDFKIIVPHMDRDDEELDAVFVGRDERTNMALVRTAKPQQWTSIKFVDRSTSIGDVVVSVGLMPDDAGYRPYVNAGIVAAHVRGPVPQVLVTGGGLAAPQSPVFNLQGEAIGVSNMAEGQPVTLNDPRTSLIAIQTPPPFFVPASDFAVTLSDPPTEGQPQSLPYMGVRQMTGLTKDVAEFFGLENHPAIEVGDVLPGAPAAAAGLKRGDVITQLDGQAIERGDAPEELPQILGRAILQRKVGDVITLSVLRGKGQPLTDVEITLEARPVRANLAGRFFAEDLGFSVRDLVMDDRYERKLEDKATGVVVAVVVPQSASQVARLQGDELITQLNGKPITDVAQFRRDYEAARKDKPQDAIVLVINRDGQDDTVRIEPPR